MGLVLLHYDLHGHFRSDFYHSVHLRHVGLPCAPAPATSDDPSVVLLMSACGLSNLHWLSMLVINRAESGGHNFSISDLNLCRCLVSCYCTLVASQAIHWCESSQLLAQHLLHWKHTS